MGRHDPQNLNLSRFSIHFHLSQLTSPRISGIGLALSSFRIHVLGRHVVPRRLYDLQPPEVTFPCELLEGYALFRVGHRAHLLMSEHQIFFSEDFLCHGLEGFLHGPCRFHHGVARHIGHAAGRCGARIRGCKRISSNHLYIIIPHSQFLGHHLAKDGI